MDKRELEQAAEQLATEELVCRGMKLVAEGSRRELDSYQPKSVFEGKKERRRLEEACQEALENYEYSLSQVADLTRKVNNLRSQSEELSAKRYWWDVPFQPEDPQEADTYCFDDGVYMEMDKVESSVERGGSFLVQKPMHINYTLLMMRLTDGKSIPLFLDKKKLRLHINEQMEIRYLYNVMSVYGQYEVVSYMNPEENPAAAIWRAYEQQAAARRAELDEFLQENDEKWDFRERIRHKSFWTNEERWMAGQMSNDDYLTESLWREYSTWDQRDKARDDIALMRIHAEQAQREAQKYFVKSRKDAVYETNLLRVMPVGEVIRCGGQLMAILLYTQPQPAKEYDCAPEVDMTELTGKYFNVKELFRRKPALIPLLRYIATIYAEELPDYRVLKPCPSGCPDELWRVWAEVRWARKFAAAKK